MQEEHHRLRVIVWGSGDIASAVALALFRAGHGVVIVEGPQPAAIRRRMAFTDAVFDGAAILDGVAAVRLTGLEELAPLLNAHQRIPLLVGTPDNLLAYAPMEILIDARMRKRAQPEVLRGRTLLTIGLGPNFVAGEHVDVAIETAWGDALGAVITAGGTQPLRGEPRAIAGHARDRYVYAPLPGVFETDCNVGDKVAADQPVASIGEATLLSPLTGILRGITRSGVVVDAGTKVVEVDPRLTDAVVDGVGERPAIIADGVVAAIQRSGLHCVGTRFGECHSG